MSFVHRFGILILGVAFILFGLVFGIVKIPSPGFGFTAYAPLTSTTFVPMGGFGPTEVAFLLAGVGLVLVAGWIGFQLGRRYSG